MNDPAASKSPYTEAYYSHIDASSKNSAAVVVPLICQLLQPKSVIDVGCGRGFWAAAFLQQGVPEVLGIDGEWVDPEKLAIPPKSFRQMDLGRDLTLDKRYDLAVSLEVAEHLPPESSEAFIASLTKAAPAVLFSAAIPGQSGDNHINERWQSFWIRLFANHHFVPIDCVRRNIWAKSNVAYWYAQNSFLFMSKDQLTNATPRLRAAAAMSRGPYAYAHPKLFDAYRTRLAKLMAAYQALGKENQKLKMRVQQLESQSGGSGL